MNKLYAKLVYIVISAMLISLQSFGHHSATMYEVSKEVTKTGVVKEFQYTNPHSWLVVEVTNEDGTVTTWGFEGEGPSTLMRAGIRKSDLSPGTRVTVTGYPMRDGRPAGVFKKIIRLDDGKIFDPKAGIKLR